MANYYEIPGGLAWVKSNLQVIIGNQSLEKIMEFGDSWRSRGQTPLVHVISPAMDNGRMWDNHEDYSGLLDNIPSHAEHFCRPIRMNISLDKFEKEILLKFKDK